MSHVRNSEHDFDGLEGLDSERMERVKQARIEARDIIERLEPFHINSWADLLTKLDDCRETAIRNARLLDPAFREAWELQLRDTKSDKSPQIDFFKRGLAGIAVLFLALILGSFTNFPSKTGLFVWWVVFPLIIAGSIWLTVVILERRQAAKWRSSN